METTNIDHLGIAVSSLDEGAALYKTLGLDLEGVEEVPEQGVRVGFLPVGATRLELLEPTGPTSPIARHLERRGPGLHHLCLRVDDIRDAMARLKGQGYRLLSEEPQPGAHGCLVCFVHPSSAGGVLLELSQPAGGWRWGAVWNDRLEAVESIDAGSVVVVHCRSPKEKLWGILLRLDGIGAAMRGLDVNSVEDWLRQEASGGEELLAPSTVLIPMHRVERIYLDETSGSVVGIADRYRAACSRDVRDALLGAGPPTDVQ